MIINETKVDTFHICNTHSSDQFPTIAKKRGLLHKLIKGDLNKQFVVQLHGCIVKCPYYHTIKSSKPTKYYFNELVEEFGRAYKEHNVGVFHMVGGAPSLLMKDWCSIPMHLFPFHLFTSNLLLTEGKYDSSVLYTMGIKNALYTINIKGVNSIDYKKNTGVNIDWLLFWNNFDKVLKSKLQFYVVFTNPDPEGIDKFKEKIFKNS